MNQQSYTLLIRDIILFKKGKIVHKKKKWKEKNESLLGAREKNESAEEEKVFLKKYINFYFLN